MRSLPLVACTLGAGAQETRRAEWEDLLRQAAAREEIAGGAR